MYQFLKSDQILLLLEICVLNMLYKSSDFIISNFSEFDNMNS